MKKCLFSLSNSMFCVSLWVDWAGHCQGVPQPIILGRDASCRVTFQAGWPVRRGAWPAAFYWRTWINAIHLLLAQLSIMMTYHSMDLSENFHLYAHQSSLKTGLPTEMLTVLSKYEKENLSLPLEIRKVAKNKKKEELPWDPCCTDWLGNGVYGVFGIPENCCPLGDWLWEDGEPCFCKREGGTKAFKGLTSGEIMLGASLEKENTEKLHISHGKMKYLNKLFP